MPRKKKNKKYLGDACPVCGSELIIGEPPEPEGVDVITRKVACSDCGSHWEETFKLTCATVLVDGTDTHGDSGAETKGEANVP